MPTTSQTSSTAVIPRPIDYLVCNNKSQQLTNHPFQTYLKVKEDDYGSMKFALQAELLAN